MGNSWARNGHTRVHWTHHEGTMGTPWTMEIPWDIGPTMRTTWRHHGHAMEALWCIGPTMETPWGHHSRTMVLRVHHAGAMSTPWARHGHIMALVSTTKAPRERHGHIMDTPWSTMKAQWARHGDTMGAPWRYTMETQWCTEPTMETMGTPRPSHGAPGPSWRRYGHNIGMQ